MRNPSEGCLQDQISGISPLGRNDMHLITDFVNQKR